MAASKDSGSNGKHPAKKKRQLSPAARKRLSDAAKKRVAEGKMGGAKFGRMGGRPRKPRAAQEVAEEARKEAKEIIQVFKDGIDPNMPQSTRLAHATAWLDVEAKEAKIALAEEERDSKDMSRDEMIKLLAEGMAQGPVAEMLKNAPQIEAEAGIVDATVVEDDDDAEDEAEAA